MEFAQTLEADFGDRGVVLPSHPPIVEGLVIKSGEGNLIAGTALVSGDAAGLVCASDASQPDAILVEDVDVTSEAKTARCLVHGMVVRARLVDASGATDAVASDTLVAKLSARGIYAGQGWDYSILAGGQ